MKSIRHCACCGKQYVYCPSDSPDGRDMWRMAFDTEICRDVFHILADCSSGNMTKDEATDAIKAKDLADLSIFKDSIRQQIEALIADDKKRRKEPIVVLDEQVVEDSVLSVEDDE